MPPGGLQFNSPKNKVLETKYRQIFKILMSLSHFGWRRLLERGRLLEKKKKKKNGTCLVQLSILADWTLDICHFGAVWLILFLVLETILSFH